MIPQKIHYCWFGNNKKSKMMERCIASWKKYCEDYQIIEWNENSFDIYQFPYAQYCYEHNKWAFLSDFVRLMVVYREGGVYLDTDVELIKPLEPLLVNQAFFGFESDDYVATGLGFGAVKGHPMVKAMLDCYLNMEADGNGEFQLIPCPKLNTKALVECGLELNGLEQNVEGALILAKDRLNPYDDRTDILKITEGTYSIHWYAKSWIPKYKVLRSKVLRPFHRAWGIDCFDWLKKRKI